MGLVDLLHLAGLIGGALNLLQRGEVVIAAEGVIVLVDAQAQPQEGPICRPSPRGSESNHHVWDSC